MRLASCVLYLKLSCELAGFLVDNVVKVVNVNKFESLLTYIYPSE